MKIGSTEAETCKLNDWIVGDILEEDEDCPTCQIIITAIGKSHILCCWRDNAQCAWESEIDTSLHERPWRKVGHERQPGESYNMNDEATVTLTEVGAAAWRKHWEPAVLGTGGHCESLGTNAQAGDTISTELWQTYMVFGPRTYHGCDIPFVENRITIRKRS